MAHSYTDVAAAHIRLVHSFLSRRRRWLQLTENQYEEVLSRLYVEYLLAVQAWVRLPPGGALSTFVYKRLAWRLPRVLGEVFKPMGWLQRYMRQRAYSTAARTYTVEHPGERQERHEVLLWGLRHLPASQERAMRLAYGLGGERETPVKECAERLGVTESHIRYLLVSGRQKLATLLQSRLGDDFF